MNCIENSPHLFETRPNVYRFGLIDTIDILDSRNDGCYRHENHDRHQRQYRNHRIDTNKRDNKCTESIIEDYLLLFLVALKRANCFL